MKLQAARQKQSADRLGKRAKITDLRDKLSAEQRALTDLNHITPRISQP
jgi:hypothetical protein